MPISPKGYDINRARAVDYLNNAPQVYVIDRFVSFDPNNRFHSKSSLQQTIPCFVHEKNVD